MYYTEGDTKGNLTQSMLSSGYSDSYAKTACNVLSRNVEFNRAVEARKAIIEKAESVTIESVRANFIEDRQLCLDAYDRTNLIRVDENLAKHVGLYGIDNAQKAPDERKFTYIEAQQLFIDSNKRDAEIAEISEGLAV